MCEEEGGVGLGRLALVLDFVFVCFVQCERGRRRGHGGTGKGARQHGLWEFEGWRCGRK